VPYPVINVKGVDTRGNQNSQEERNENQKIIQGEAHACATVETRGPQDGRHNTRLTDQLPCVANVSPRLPQVAEGNTPQATDVAGRHLLYDTTMTRVFLADGQSDERKALRVLLQDLKMKIVGESADWSTTLAEVPKTDLDMLLIDWGLLPTDKGVQSLAQLRLACPNAIVVVLISHLDSRQQAALSAGADAFISKGETPERVADRLRAAAESIRS